MRHTLDVMHTEKNVAKNILRTLFGEKDGAKVRLDMQNRRIRQHLWLRKIGDKENRAFMPNVTYVLSKQDQELFLRPLKSMKVPTYYCGSLHSKISKGKLSGLKSHDYHVLLEDIMPVCLRNIGNVAVSSVVIWLIRMFKKNC